MSASKRRWVMFAMLAAALTANLAAQTRQQPPPTRTGTVQRPPDSPRPKVTPPPQREAAGRLGRGLAPLTANMTPQQLQVHMDAWALIEAERRLQLSKDQMPGFLLRMSRLQDLRRQYNMERRRILNDLNSMASNENVKEEALIERLKAFDEASQRVTGDVRKALEEMDSVLSPVQRARFRLFEEAVERMKIDLLTKIR